MGVFGVVVGGGGAYEGLLGVVRVFEGVLEVFGGAYGGLWVMGGL